MSDSDGLECFHHIAGCEYRPGAAFPSKVCLTCGQEHADTHMQSDLRAADDGDADVAALWLHDMGCSVLDMRGVLIVNWGARREALDAKAARFVVGEFLYTPALVASGKAEAVKHPAHKEDGDGRGRLLYADAYVLHTRHTRRSCPSRSTTSASRKVRNSTSGFTTRGAAIYLSASEVDKAGDGAGGDEGKQYALRWVNCIGPKMTNIKSMSDWGAAKNEAWLESQVLWLCSHFII